jgi:hypothetical protein
MRLIGGLLLTSGRHLFLRVECGLFFMPLMEVGDACLPALLMAAEPIRRSSSWKRSGHH